MSRFNQNGIAAFLPLILSAIGLALILVVGYFTFKDSYLTVLNSSKAKCTTTKTSPTTSPSSSLPANTCVVNDIDWSVYFKHTGTLTNKKTYKDKTLVSFNLEDKFRLDSLVFVSTLLNNDEPNLSLKGYVTTNVNSVFSSTDIYAVYNDKIYIIDALERTIKIYILDNDAQFNYIKELPLPSYVKGDFYSMDCQNEVCELRTAFHLESGCDLKLNLKTEKFSDYACREPGPENN